MRIKVRKWGRSLGLLIPKAIIRKAQLDEDSVVEVSLVDGTIVIKPVHITGRTLEQLLAGVHSGNIHRGFESTGPVGNEIW